MMRLRTWATALAALAAVSVTIAANPRRAGILLQVLSGPVAASSGAISEHELEEINAMTPQDQATHLLERAINHYTGALEEISRRAEAWTGHIHSVPNLDTMADTAYNSSDLRIRAAALEIWLARDNIARNPQAVDQLIQNAAVSSDRKYFYLSYLGILGNRGIEPQRAFDTLVQYAHDPDPQARAAAINGLGLLGTENTIAPLLDIFHDDTSHDFRERAACNLVDSGMLSREQRKKAVPELIRFSQDPNLDATTKKWVYQALREITGQDLKDDPATWLNWYGAHTGSR